MFYPMNILVDLHSSTHRVLDLFPQTATLSNSLNDKTIDASNLIPKECICAYMQVYDLSVSVMATGSLVYELI